MKISIKVPKKKTDKWMLGFGARPRSMLRADTLCHRLERLLGRLLLATKLKEKTTIKVLEYEDGSWTNVNETIASLNRNYLLWATACFLEDYLSKKVLRRIEKTYYKKAGDICL